MNASELDMKEKFIFSKEDKEKNLGKGPWCEEPDEIRFEAYGLECLVKRVLFPDNIHWFGGHLCGYVLVPKTHLLYEKNRKDLDLEVHGGITFNEIHDEILTIGFDCAHLYDVVPGLYDVVPGAEKVLEKDREYLERIFPLFRDGTTYRDKDYVINETINLARQIKEYKGDD